MIPKNACITNRLVRAAAAALFMGAAPMAFAASAETQAATPQENAPDPVTATAVTPANAKAAATAADTIEDNSSATAATGLPALDDPLAEPPPLGDLAEQNPTATPTGNVVVNLIQRLVEKGILTRAEATEMILQAERDAALARHNAEAVELLAADAAMASSDDVVVTHIPEPVKDRMREEIKQELLADAKEGEWGGFSGKDDSEHRFRFSGDFRTRYDGTMFPDGNDNTGAFPDFNRINTGDPFDVAGTDFSPQWNVDEERHRFRLRARFGGEMDLGEGFTAGMRVGTGNDSSPVSANQTFGSSGGNFSKYSLWLDRAFLKWEWQPDDELPEIAETNSSKGGKQIGSSISAGSGGWNPDASIAMMIGRFDNPFFRVSEIMWDGDLGFDGFALQARREITEGVTPFFNGGLFPIFNTDFNFSTNSPDKFESIDKWLYGVQMGVDLRKDKDIAAKIGVAWFEFDNVEGRLSEPFLPLSTKDAGNTDHTRPSFAQKGNTYMALRDITADALNNYGTSQQYQYFGLASRYQVLAYNAKVDFNFFEPVQISLLGEYSTNLAFDENKTSSLAVNNRGPSGTSGGPGGFEGGDTAWNVGVQFGHGDLDKAGDWKALLGYRYVESDAYVDAFTDSDFGVGGTNMEGFTIGASYAVSPNVFFALRWMGARQIAGPPLKSDIIQFDINATF